MIHPNILSLKSPDTFDRNTPSSKVGDSDLIPSVSKPTVPKSILDDGSGSIKNIFSSSYSHVYRIAK